MPLIVGNAEIRQLWPPAVLGGNSLRPLAFYSFAVNHAISGYDVWSYHALSLAVHVAAALALFGFARGALRLPRVGLGDEPASATAVAVALLWAVHPLNTQAVNYIVQRAEAMAGLASIAALHCLVRAVTAVDGGRRWQVATVLASYAALGCKEVAFTLPLTLYLFDVLVVTGSFSAPLRRRTGLYVALVAPFVLVPLVWLAVAPWRLGTLRAAPDAGSSLEYAWSQGAVISGYLRRVLWPSGLNLDHAWDPGQHRTGTIAGAVLVGGALVVVAESVRRRAPAGWLGASFFLFLAPSSSFHPLADRMVEHRMYLAAIPCVTAAVLFARAALRRIEDPDGRRLVGAAAFAIAAAGLGAATFVRNADYSSAERMWTDVVAKAPHNARGHYNLGCALLEAGGAENEERALACFRETLRLRPDHTGAHNNAGTVLFKRGRHEEAASHFRDGLGSGDPPFQSLRNYGSALIEIKRLDEAASVLRRAESLRGDRPADAATAARLARDIGFCLAASGAPGEALRHLRRAVELDPGLTVAWRDLAALHGRLGDRAAAIDAWIAAIAADPASVTARVEAVAFCVDPTNRAAAREHLESLVRRSPPDPEAGRLLEFVRRAR